MEGVDTSRWWRAMGIVEVPDDVVAFGTEDLAMVRALRVVMGQDDRRRGTRLPSGPTPRRQLLADRRGPDRVIEDLLGTRVPSIESLDTPADRIGGVQTDEAAMLHRVVRPVDDLRVAPPPVRIAGPMDRRRCGPAHRGDRFHRHLRFLADVQAHDPSVLADVVERFEAESVDVVSHHGGRVVKFIGDEAFFVVDDMSRGRRCGPGGGERMGEGETEGLPAHRNRQWTDGHHRR